MKIKDKNQIKNYKKIENLFDKCVKDSINILNSKSKKNIVKRKVSVKKPIPKRIKRRKKRKV